MSQNPPSARTPEPAEEIDVVVAGELLVDLIGEGAEGLLGSTEAFRRYAGGSAANLAANLSRLGGRVELVARVGRDSLGGFLLRSLQAAGVGSAHVAVDPEAPTSLVLVARSSGTAEFLACRGADARITPAQLPARMLAAARLFHTSAFALAREPARSAIAQAAGRVAEHGGRLSLDANYAPALWPDREEAQSVLAAYCRSGALVKASADDVARLFGEPSPDAARAAHRFHGWGAELVCITEGARGCRVSWNRGRERGRVSPPPTTVADATGAGDAFWAGFLTARLDGRDPLVCARAGTRLAALKLAVVGPLHGPLDRGWLYGDEEVVLDG